MLLRRAHAQPLRDARPGLGRPAPPLATLAAASQHPAPERDAPHRAGARDDPRDDPHGSPRRAGEPVGAPLAGARDDPRGSPRRAGEPVGAPLAGARDDPRCGGRAARSGTGYGMLLRRAHAQPLRDARPGLGRPAPPLATRAAAPKTPTPKAPSRPATQYEPPARTTQAGQGYVNVTSSGDSGAASPLPSIRVWVLRAAAPPATPRTPSLRQSFTNADGAPQAGAIQCTNGSDSGTMKCWSRAGQALARRLSW
jgi:hypothetical protein